MYAGELLCWHSTNITFWLGTIDEALAQKRVWNAQIVAESSVGEERSRLLASDYNRTLPHGKKHKFIAVDTKHGRVEAYPVGRELGIGVRNSPVIRKVTRITRI
jgi:hypothetical protein